MSEDEEQSEEKENSGEQPEGSLMEGQLGAGAVKREMGMLYTMNMMDASSTYRIAAMTTLSRELKRNGKISIARIRRKILISKKKLRRCRTLSQTL